jgi:uncharacterized coiled-coil DUF342 family protein
LPKLQTTQELQYKHRSVDFRQSTANEFAIWREKCDSVQSKYQQLKTQLRALQNTLEQCQRNGKNYELLAREVERLNPNE